VSGGTLIVKEAGGKITNFSGQELSEEDKYFVATNGRIHKELLDILKG